MLADALTSAAVVEPSSSDVVETAELEAMFGAFLPDASDQEKVQVAALHEDLRVQQERLATLVNEGVLTPVEHAHALNLEINWFCRRSARILGSERFQQLFDMEVEDTSNLVDEAEALARMQRTAIENEIADANALLSRYVPVQAEQKQIIKALTEIDPQKREAIMRSRWAPGSRHADWVQIITTAETAYRSGNLETSNCAAQDVVNSISKLAQVSDTGMYFVSWAHHIQGRNYEAMTLLRDAAFHYQTSLLVKMKLMEWLPPLLLMATEVKLGSVEMFQSPIESATRLSRVSELLKSNPTFPKQNRRLFENLIEDSEVTLAEAYLAIGDHSSAIRHAEEALMLARKLKDRVGEIRTIYVLYLASAVSRNKALRRIQTLLKEDKTSAAHPRVTFILAALRDEVEELPSRTSSE